MLSLTGLLLFLVAAGLIQWFVMHLIWRAHGLVGSATDGWPKASRLARRLRCLPRKGRRVIWLALLFVGSLFRDRLTV
jgi:hypothetical protein